MRYEKLSPTLALAVDDYQRAGPPALALHAARIGVVSIDATPKPPRVVVFLHPAAGASLEHLGEIGVTVNGGATGGSVRTAIVPMESIDRLTEDGAVARIVPAQRLRLSMDKARAAVKVPAFRKASKLSGKGVIVGTVDTGIEVGHPDFEGRILQIWDQTLNGTGVAEGGYGVELSGPAMSQSRDTIGHGTHVAGIAAGADPTYTGVAPRAEFVIVKTDLLDAHIADGIRYIFRIAEERNMPAVVNLSLGGQGDGHDGSDALSTVIDEAVGPGRIVCCAGGNAGNSNIHARVLVQKNRTRTIACAMAGRGPTDPAFVAAYNGWYPGTDRLEVAVVSPSEVSTPFQPVITSGSPSKDYALPEGAVQIVTPPPDPANGDHNFLVTIEPAPTPPGPPTSRGMWRLRLRGAKVSKGTVDVWVIDDQVSIFTGPAVVDSMKVGTPGAATGAITLASYTTKVEWETIFSETLTSGLELDDVSDFSSEGPRRDGAEKPDLAAPGAMIASSLSVHSPADPRFLIDPLHTIMAGTSMATPFASGLVALLLERQPDLKPEEAKALLRKNSRIPGQPAQTFDPKWGYGVVNAKGL
ncbi:MAG TPA: S8 family serine peptidase [Acidimicrobiales bacterium]|nr:S8 family serine peptidase [Acidimicrobiales bacterium]